MKTWKVTLKLNDGTTLTNEIKSASYWNAVRIAEQRHLTGDDTTADGKQVVGLNVELVP